MNNDQKILRELAAVYAGFAFDYANDEKEKLHRAVNDLRMIRPVVTIEELPWSEMDIDHELTLRCDDPDLRKAEWHLRTCIFKCRHFRADLLLDKFYPVSKIILSTGCGVDIDEKTIGEQKIGGVVSHEYHDQMPEPEDLRKFHNPVISYDEKSTLRFYDKIADAIGDVLPVKLVGAQADYSIWDWIAMLHGVENMFLDLKQRPEFMHEAADTFMRIIMSEIKQYEELNLLEPDLKYIHCTPATASDLPASEDGKVRAKNVWGRASAQIFCDVSPAMHEVFDTNYMVQLLKPFGLNYYGCCEPLHNKISIIEKIPNLRKISITPWADKVKSAELINKKYVFSAKPNPAFVALKNFSRDAAEKELRLILDACKTNGCSLDITLKDISTVSGNPYNIIEWERLVMGMVNSL